MDLGTVENKLADGTYRSPDEVSCVFACVFMKLHASAATRPTLPTRAHPYLGVRFKRIVYTRPVFSKVANEIRLVFMNATDYNPPGHPVNLAVEQTFFA